MAEHILKVFRESEKRGRAAFVGFVTAGYPSLDETVDVMIGMEPAQKVPRSELSAGAAGSPTAALTTPR